MITDEQLDTYRLQGTKIRVVRDGLEMNDVIGIVVAWDKENVVIRKHTRRVVKLSRSYIYEPFDGPRTDITAESESLKRTDLPLRKENDDESSIL